MATAAATLDRNRRAGQLVLAPSGEWLVATRRRPRPQAARLWICRQARPVTIDLAGIERIDTAGAWLLLRTEHDLSARGNRGRDAQPAADLRAAARAGPRRRLFRRRLPHPRPAHHTLIGFVAQIGEITLGPLRAAPTASSAFSALSCLTMLRAAAPPRPAEADRVGRPDGADRGQRAADRRVAVVPGRRRHRLSGRRPAAPLRRGDLYGRPAGRRHPARAWACC